jgi:Ca-activated chloride channel homolog
VSFASPVWLAALAAVPALLVLAALVARRRRRYAVRFTALDTLAAIGAAPRGRRHVPAALAALAACALVLAIARPTVSVAVPSEQAAVMLVTDVSGSMNAEDVDPTRLRATQRAAGRFLDEVPKGGRVGLVSFADTASMLQEPTTDLDAVRSAVQSLSAQGATATGDGLKAALDALRETRGRERPPAAIVLLSDGRRTAGQDPLPLAREARRLRIPVYTISLGTDGGTVTDPRQPFAPPVQVPPDPEAMRSIARASGGRSYEIADAGRLDDVYERLGSQLATEREDREVTAAFAGGALLLLGAAVGLALRGRARLP